MAVSHYIKMINRIDQLIKMQATGTPEEFAKQIGVVKSTLYSYINLMKEMGAPIKYNRFKQTFYYREAGSFEIRFVYKDLTEKERYKINGGFCFSEFETIDFDFLINSLNKNEIQTIQKRK